MADIKWIKLATDIFDNRKIRQIETMPEGDALLVIWLKLICLAGKTNDSGLVYLTQDIAYTEEMLATEFNKPLNIIRLAIMTFIKFDMIAVVDNILQLSNWEKYQSSEKLDKIREQTRIRQANYKDKIKKVTQVTQKSNAILTQGNATEQELELDKDTIINNSNIVQKSPSEIFYPLWKLYPNRKGLGSIKEATKKKIANIGYETMAKCIETYINDKPDWKQYQNGSTFFNSGYIDYLDENFIPTPKETKADVKTGPMNNFTQDLPDFKKITADLIKKQGG